MPRRVADEPKKNNVNIELNKQNEWNDIENQSGRRRSGGQWPVTTMKANEGRKKKIFALIFMVENVF